MHMTPRLSPKGIPLRRLVRAVAIAIASLSAGTAPAGAQSATIGEVKAAFLYNFARFTEWPSDAFASESDPLVIGVVGDEVLRLTLEGIIRGKLVGTRLLKTRQVRDAGDLAGAQMLYIGGTEVSRAEDFVNALQRTPVLTVGGVDRFCEKGGMINLLIEDNRVRFEIRLDATEHSRLKVSSRVLTLAKTVYGKK
jgi:hypothetical protein